MQTNSGAPLRVSLLETRSARRYALFAAVSISRSFSFAPRQSIYEGLKAKINRSETMLKSTFIIGILFASLAVIPARAAMMECSEANMMKMQTGMEKMSDMSKKDMAMKEMGMAKDSMAKKDDKDCMMHMQKAEGMMPN
jgi:hypothetical protein